jgi:twinkle protein
MNKSDCIKCGGTGTVQINRQDDREWAYCFKCNHFYASTGELEGVPSSKVVVDSRSSSTEEYSKVQRTSIAEIEALPTEALPDRGLLVHFLTKYGVKMLSDPLSEEVTHHYYPRKVGGKTVEYKERTVEGKKFTLIKGVDKKPTLSLWGMDVALAESGKRLYITEGELDCVALYQVLKTHGSNYPASVVSLNNGASSALKDISNNKKDLAKFKEIVLVFDQDEPGTKAVAEVRRLLPDVLIADLPEKDANECLIAGKGEQLRKAVLFDACIPKPTTLITDFTPYMEDVLSEPVMGYEWPWPKATKLTYGRRPGEVYYFGAGPKMGKSELVNELLKKDKQLGLKPLFCKFEEPIRHSLRVLSGKEMNAMFHIPERNYTRSLRKEGFDAINGDMVCMILENVPRWDDIKLDIRYAVTVLGCKSVYIDPYTSLTEGMSAGDANTEIARISREMYQMTKDLGFMMFCFCHLNNPKSGPSHQYGGKVQSDQFTGSRSAVRASHYVFGLEGNKDPEIEESERNRRKLVLLEDRMFGRSGYISLFFNNITGELLECDEEVVTNKQFNPQADVNY